MTDSNKTITEIDPDRELSRLVSVSEAALRAAELHADKHGLSFSIEPAYGMGGWYTGCGDNDPEAADGYGEPLYGWAASSQSC